jgi:hypothetical protein
MDLWIKIRSLFEGKGAADAAAGMDKVSDAAKKTTPSIEGVKMSSDKAFSSMNAASQIATGGISGAGTAVRNLAEFFPKLAKSLPLGPLGLLLAAVNAVKLGVDMWRAAQEKAAETLRKIAAGNMEARIQREAAAYAELSAAIRRTSEARQSDYDMEQARNDAVLRADLAKLEHEKALALGNLAPDDDIGRRKVELDSQTKRGDLEAAAAKRRADLDDAKEAEKADAAASLLAAAEAQQEAEIENFRKMAAARQHLLDQVRKNSSSWSSYLSFSEDKAWNNAADGLKEYSAGAREAVDRRKAAGADAESAERAIRDAQARREVMGIDRGARSTAEKTREVTEYVAGRDLDRDNNKAIDDEIKNLNERLAGASERQVAALQQMVTAAERNGELSVSLLKSLVAGQDRLAREQQNAQAATRTRQ